jgi:hypothetical protein
VDRSFENWLFFGDSDPLKLPFWCPHTQTTFADDHGKAICLRCGSLVQTVLTLELIQASIRRMRDGR